MRTPYSSFKIRVHNIPNTNYEKLVHQWKSLDLRRQIRGFGEKWRYIVFQTSSNLTYQTFIGVFEINYNVMLISYLFKPF